jgi:hypothetical protein
MKTSKYILIGVFLLHVLAACNTKETVLYVAPDGNDAWSGSLEQANSDGSNGPLATLEGARIAVRKMIDEGLNGPVSVLIREGEYELSETVVYAVDDAGTASFPNTYKAYPGEQPVFTGGKKLTNWEPSAYDPEGLPEAASGKLYTASIPEDLKGRWQITTLYDGNRLLSRSRSGRLEVSDDHVPDLNNVQPKKFRIKDWDGKPLVFSRELTYEGDDIKNWSNPSDIEILISPRNNWLINLLPLERIDAEKKIAHFAIDPTYTPMPDDHYYVENAIEYLDEPGEWVFNSEKGVVYYWPEGDIATADISAPYLQEFIRVEGIEDSDAIRFINFEGLTFRHGLRDTWQVDDKGIQHDWDMYDKGNAILRFRHAEDCSVSKCVFESSSGTGVRLDMHCQRITVSDNILARLGGTGILLSGYAPGIRDENKNNTVTNNYIHHVGSIYTHSPGIFVAQSGHNLISHNTIHDLGYTAIVISGCRPKFFTLEGLLRNRREWVSSLRMDEVEATLDMELTPETTLTIDHLEPFFHARENRITDNEIYNVMKVLHDGNAIYFSGMGLNNLAERNFLHDISGDRGFIRLDDHSAYTKIVNNVGLRTSMMFVMKGPAEYRNNFAINCVRMTNKKWYEHELDNIIFYCTQENYGKLVKEDQFIFDEFKRISNSIVFGGMALADVEKDMDLFPADRRGDAETGLLHTDPMFDEAAFEQKIFRFMPGSPAEKLGIAPIDLSDVGSTLAK